MEQELFNEIGSNINGAVKGNLFGKECFKIGGKPFVCFFQQCMVFKLQGELHDEAMSFDGSILFDPSGKGRPMKEWIQVPYQYKEHWSKFAQEAHDYVGSLNK